MKNTKLNEDFKNIVKKMESTNLPVDEKDWLEEFRKCTKYKSVEEMIKRFKVLAGL